jgi:hypothetical protein
MINQDVADIGGLGELKIVHNALIGRRTATVESTQQYITRACQDRILRVLWFRTMNDRKESISTAHNKTLQWPLERQEILRESWSWNPLEAGTCNLGGCSWFCLPDSSRTCELLGGIEIFPDLKRGKVDFVSSDARHDTCKKIRKTSRSQKSSNERICNRR